MAKKIRFPLEMAEGVQVRTLEELKENFCLPQVLAYLENGKLNTWLRDRYEDELADALEALDMEATDLPIKICGLFKVEPNMTDVEDMEKIQERNRKIEQLKGHVDDDKYIEVVDQIAFDQDELYDLLDEGKTTIYLCGESFSIPLGKKGIEYIGVNNPIVKIASKTAVDWDEKKITLSGVRFDEAYQILLKKDNKSSTSVVKAPDFTGMTDLEIFQYIKNNPIPEENTPEYKEMIKNIISRKKTGPGHAFSALMFDYNFAFVLVENRKKFGKTSSKIISIESVLEGLRDR